MQVAVCANIKVMCYQVQGTADIKCGSDSSMKKANQQFSMNCYVYLCCTDQLTTSREMR